MTKNRGNKSVLSKTNDFKIFGAFCPIKNNNMMG